MEAKTIEAMVVEKKDTGKKALQKELICIKCPKGCKITIDLDETNAIQSITGNSCPRGEEYARKEITAPTRMITSTVPIDKSDIRVIPVRLSDEIPKEHIFDVMEVIRGCRVSAPVSLGQVIVKNVCGLGIDLVAAADAAEEHANL